MTMTDRRETVTQAFAVLVDELAPWVEERAGSRVPNGDWPRLVQTRDLERGIRGGIYTKRDLATQLRVITERFVGYGLVFPELSRQGRAAATDLVNVRDDWAAREPFTDLEAAEALASVTRLLEAMGMSDAADTVEGLAAGLDLSRTDGRAMAAPEVQVEHPPVADAPEPDRPEPAEVLVSPITVEIDAGPFVSFAMAHSHIRPISSITIVNSGEELRGALIDVQVIGETGPLSRVMTRRADLAANRTLVIRDLDLQLEADAMFRVADPQAGRIRVDVRREAGAQALASAAVRVDVLAATQWRATPLQLALELLPAHVQPNSPSITALLRDAATLLEASTGNSALNGYDGEDPARVDAIARAVFDAMRARDIAYALPPASWGVGQRVRTPSEVLDGRLGTCLDTSVTFAAALEQAGIDAVLWVVEGHAFAGYFREQGSSIGASASTDANRAVNLVRLKAMRLVETTMVTSVDPSVTFRSATEGPVLRWLDEDFESVKGVVDVASARREQIYPLPARSIDDDGTVTVTEYRPAQREDDEVIETAPDVGGRRRGDDSAPARVRRWKNALLDLSLRNRLINLGTRSGFGVRTTATSIGLLEDLINSGTRVGLRAWDDVSAVQEQRGIDSVERFGDSEIDAVLRSEKAVHLNIAGASYVDQLRKLAKQARTITEETGANNLYLALGSLVWSIDGKELRSPLVLIPVNLVPGTRGSFALQLDDSGQSTPNFCLLEKLRQTDNLVIDALAHPLEDESGIDLDAAFRGTREALAAAHLPYRVEDTAHLGILQFAKFRLWKDLDDNWSELAKNPLVRHLIESPTEQFADPVEPVTGVDLDDLAARSPIPSDASQLEAVAEAIAGRSFVLEGPPGTGKSQTITNLLAHAMSAGKRVLFVAEKRAALSVVQKRLADVGLAPLALDLHDKAARPTAVRQQILAALDLRARADEEALRTASSSVESVRRSLGRYARDLHSTNAAGLSLYSARTALLAARPDVAPLPVFAPFVASASPETFDRVGDALRLLPDTADDARPSSRHPWGFINRPLAAQVVPLVHAASKDFDRRLEELGQDPRASDVLGRLRSVADADAWLAIEGAARLPLSVLDASATPAWATSIEQATARLAELATPAPWQSTVDPSVLRLDLDSIASQASAADASGFFGRKKRRRAVLERVRPALVGGANPRLDSLAGLINELIKARGFALSMRDWVRAIAGVEIADSWNPFVSSERESVLEQITVVRSRRDAVSDALSLDHLRDVLRGRYAEPGADAIRDGVADLAKAWRYLSETVGERAARTSWFDERRFVDAWSETRAQRAIATPVTLEHWVAFLTALEPLSSAGLVDARRGLLTGATPAEDAGAAFWKGVAESSVAERAETTRLGQFDAAAQGTRVARFVAESRRLQSALPDALPARIVASRNFDAMSTRGRMGELRRELQKKRGTLKVRELMSAYHDIITTIMPCTLMSPDSVARFLPAVADLFDLVVFDEASQVRVADSIGAMGRARSVVVVGDSKQMPPSSAFGAGGPSADDPESREVVQDEESILSEAAQARIGQRMLTWHYRSQDEALIAFSNRNYYDGRLSSFPAPIATAGGGGSDDIGVSFVRINGRFDRQGAGAALRTNRAEAEAIVDEIRSRFDASAEAAPSVGVVTFNLQQRDLIENMLRDLEDPRVTAALDDAADGLFVKNLENVQGDERDTILFSVAFSANEKGVLPLLFGPVSQVGGERRLNVAITRARRQVILYASFEPSDIRETASVGLSHLRDYLAMAKAGTEALLSDSRRIAVVDRHRDDIADELRAAGLVVSTDVGLSDFRVDLSLASADCAGRPLVAVLLDGEAWRGRQTVGDRDGLPVEVLGGLMKWPAVERVWLPEWLQNRDAVVARLVDAVERARVQVQEAAGEDELSLDDIDVPEEVSLAYAGTGRPRVGFPSVDAIPAEAIPPDRLTASMPSPVSNGIDSRSSTSAAGTQSFRAWTPRHLGTVQVLDLLPSAESASRVRAAVLDVVAVEAPVHIDRLARLVGNAFGLEKVVSTRAKSLLAFLPPENRRADDKAFAWPTDVGPNDYRGLRVASDPDERPLLRHIALAEIANAMRFIAEQSFGATDDDVRRGALNLFGFRRMTTDSEARLDRALAFALQSGRLVRSVYGLGIGPSS